MNLQSIADSALKLILETGNYLLQERKAFDSHLIEEKSAHNLVTTVDKGAEKRLVEGLKKILPEAGFVAEEGTSTKKGEVYNWIVDPIDGTTNFVHDLPAYSISVALQRNNETVIGLVHIPATQELFYSWEGAPAFLNGVEIHVSKTENIDQSLMATGFPYATYPKLDNLLELYKWFLINSRGVRRFGSAAIDLAYTAAGKYEGFYEWGLSPWDVAAGAFLVKQAGGKVTDFNDETDYINGNGILATNEKTHAELTTILSRYDL